MPLTAAVVGHVEWIEFGRVDHVPAAGEILHVSDSWEEPGGGGAVAAVQLAKLAGEATLYTALGDDAVGHRCKTDKSYKPDSGSAKRGHAFCRFCSRAI